MPLVSAGDLLRAAREGGYAVGAFSVDNLESMEGVLQMAERLASPVILLTGQATAQHTELEYLAALAREMGSRFRIPFSIQLDHGVDFEQAMRCIRCGYPSIMIDASALSFSDNVRITREVVRAAHAVGVSVEAEIGNVPRPGPNGELPADPAAYFTVPDDAARFVEQTGVDVLAVAYGSVHGVYQGPKMPLDFERLAAISERVTIPLALHGGTGVADEDVRTSIRYGIAKVNVGTEWRRRTLERWHELFAAGEVVDFHRVLATMRETVATVVEEKSRLFGSVDKVDVASSLVLPPSAKGSDGEALEGHGVQAS